MNLQKSSIFIVSKRMLLIEAAIVWTFAGVMLLFRGSAMLNSSGEFTWPKIFACIFSGLIFFALIFMKLSRKHVDRITNLPGEQHHFYEFFNLRSYLMMAGMISMGIFLRKSLIVPLSSLSLAYITMGIPLLFSSIRFYFNWFKFVPVINPPASDL